MRDEPDDEDFLSSLPPLVKSAAMGDLGAVRSLLAGGSSPNERDESGWGALHAAAVRGHASVVAALLEAGADVDACGEDGITALWNAAGPTPSGAVIRLLLDTGANPNATDAQFGWTPLSRAAEYDNAESVSVLIAAGADVTQTDAHGFTLLMTAAENGSEAAARLLLAAGVDPSLICDRKTAADLARDHGYFALARLLAEGHV